MTDTAPAVDPKSSEGLLRRFAHAWRLHRSNPIVLHPLLEADLDKLVAEHEAAGGDAEADAAVAAQAAVDKADAAAQTVTAEAVVPPPPDEPFGHVVDPAPPEPPVEDLVAAEAAAAKAEAELVALQATPPATP